MGAKNDFQEIKTHVFFISIDWNKLEDRQIKPPFNPGVVRLLPSGIISPFKYCFIAENF